MNKSNNLNKRIRIKRDDIVIVVAGKEKGKKGKVLFVDRKKERIVVEGINQRKKFIRRSQENPKGGVMQIETPLHISNVMYYDDKAKKGKRIGYLLDETKGKKQRIVRESNNQTRKID